MTKSLLAISIIFTTVHVGVANAQNGEALFKAKCAACHTATKARLVGPGLADIDDKRSDEWLISFVKSSQAMIKSGDADAVAVFNEYNKSVMPDQPLSDAEVLAIIDFLDSGESVPPANGTAGQEVEPPSEPEGPPTEQAVAKGKRLFTGVDRFANGGPSCISCHHVEEEGVIASGSLAIDLSQAQTKLTSAGLVGIIEGVPFPAMKEAYREKKISKQEAKYVSAFLWSVSQKTKGKKVSDDMTSKFFAVGLLGSLLLMGVLPLIGYRRKKESVNKRIYDRQTRSIGMN